MDIVMKSFTDEELRWLRTCGVPCSSFDHGGGVISAIVVDTKSQIAYVDIPRHMLTVDQILNAKEKITENVENTIKLHRPIGGSDY